MKSITTTNLLSELKQTKDINQFLEAHDLESSTSAPSTYLSHLLTAHNMKPSQLAVEALMDRSFTYQLINGTRTPNRNILLRFAFALHLSLIETQHLLLHYQKGELYVRILHDALIIYAIENHLNLADINDLLIQYNQAALLYDEK